MTDPSPLPPQADRRFEAVVLWSTFPTISDRTAEAVVGLRDAGMPVGVVAPMRLDDLARRFGDRSDPAGSLLLADSEDPAVLSLWTDGTQREISSRAPTHDRQSEVLDRTGRNFVGKLADLGISTAPLTRPGDPVKIQVELLADGDARTKPQGFEEFLENRFKGHKRFSIEGGETTIAIVEELLERAAGMGAEEVVIGMAHRGRLTLLANVVGKGVAQMFSEFEGDLDPESNDGQGDVKYHLGAANVRHVAGNAAGGRTITVSVAADP